MSAPARVKPTIGYDALVDPQCEAIVVHCSDPRFQRAFTEFTTRELGLGIGDFMPLIVSGGASVLAHPLRLPKEFKFMRDRLEFYRSVMPSLKRVVRAALETTLAQLDLVAERYFARFARAAAQQVIFERVG